MKLVTYSRQAQSRLGVWLPPYVLDLQSAGVYVLGESSESERFSDVCYSMMNLLKSWDGHWKTVSAVANRVQHDSTKNHEEFLSKGILIPIENVQLQAPLPAPGKVICVAGNFPAPGVGKKPEYPVIFLKPSSTVTGPGMPVWLSDITKDVAIEVELAIVISKTTRHVSIEESFSYIAGYILANDIGDRILEQRTSQWTSGKMFDSFTPMGPWLVTKDEIGFEDSLEMLSLVNGKVVQKGSTSEMFFKVPELVSILSDLTTLQPGDVILTGSTKCMGDDPNPLVALSAGDTVSIKIDGLGELTNPVLKEL